MRDRVRELVDGLVEEEAESKFNDGVGKRINRKIEVSSVAIQGSHRLVPVEVMAKHQVSDGVGKRVHGEIEVSSKDEMSYGSRGEEVQWLIEFISEFNVMQGGRDVCGISEPFYFAWSVPFKLK